MAKFVLVEGEGDTSSSALANPERSTSAAAAAADAEMSTDRPSAPPSESKRETKEGSREAVAIEVH